MLILESIARKIQTVTTILGRNFGAMKSKVCKLSCKIYCITLSLFVIMIGYAWVHKEIKPKNQIHHNCLYLASKDLSLWFLPATHLIVSYIYQYILYLKRFIFISPDSYWVDIEDPEEQRKAVVFYIINFILFITVFLRTPDLLS